MSASEEAVPPGEAREDHSAELRLWLRLLAVSNLIESEIRKRLRERFATTLPRFDLMAQLERAPEGILLGELSRRMMVSNGNVTGLVERLTQEGLIVRETLENDRRASRVSLTPAGRTAFAEMAAEHSEWVAEIVGGLDAAALGDLYHRLGDLRASVTSATEGPTKTRTGDA
ncbi:MarR family winged helix-turn-helix transcriptional regulator [Acuticoccus sp. I52.16.1]|uniref:MarR family winged helix-turn-helix transcriptional regulator n=1 Tax=Acuticoccus sp. I52.16.1 TaxID=2928472 RepID=UPI001FD01055|nr:MarR family transcriptional regulator [Acuticoccus sp. I52.16.1]UOM33986.1 MarR family transcriptional regulator [Acuticoccus sp. I52.16.1]